MIPKSSADFAFHELSIRHGQRLGRDQAREVGKVVEAREVLYGTYERSATSWCLAFQLVDVASGRPSGQIVRRGGSLVELIPQVTTSVLTEIGCSPTAAEISRIQRPLTRSPEVLEILSRLQHRSKPLLKLDEADLRRALALDPGCAYTLQGLAVVLDQEGRLDEAFTIARRAVEADPECGLAHKTLGSICLDRDLPERAERELIQATRLLPDSPKGRLVLADLYLDEGRLAEAVKVLRQAERIASFEPTVHAKLGVVYARLGQNGRAVAELRLAERCEAEPDARTDVVLARTCAALHDLPEAIRLLERHVERLGDSRELGPDLARDKEQSRETLAMLKATLVPSFVSVSAPCGCRPSAPKNTAAPADVEGQHRPTLKPFASTSEMQIWTEKVVGPEREPLGKAKRIFDALTTKVASTSEPGERTAIEAFRTLSRPRAALSCEEYASLYIALARSVGVDACFVVVDRDAFNSPTAHACAGVVLTNGQALLVDPGYAWFGAPHREWKFLTDDQAIAILLSETAKTSKQKLAVSLFPQSARVHFNFAYNLARNGRLSEADRELQQGLRIDKTSWRAKYAEAAVEASGGNLVQAELHAKEALALYPDLSAAHYLLGWTLKERGRLEEARDEFRTALQDATSTAAEAAARDKIADLNSLLAKSAAERGVR